MNTNSPVRKDMHLLVVVLFEETFLDSLILSITSIGGGQVTVLDGVSGTQNLSQSIPFFTEFLGLGGRKICKVLLSAVAGRDTVEHLLEVLEEAGIRFVEKELGEIYALSLAGAVTVEGSAYGLF